MKSLLTALACAAVVAGCSTNQPAAERASVEQAQAPDTAAAPSDGKRMMTGSRLARKSTDRTLKSVGNQDYKDDAAQDVRSLGNVVGARSY